MRYIKTVVFLCREYKRIHPKGSIVKFLNRLFCLTTVDEMYRIADAVSRFGAENFIL